MIVTILATIVVLGVLIFVHELGHFLAAKAVDIRVVRFSIGLGPKMFGVTRGETEYVVSWLPLGGYVKMAGMADEEVMGRLEGGVEEEPEPSPRDFEAKPVWARGLVLSAGVLMNALFAFGAFSVVAAGQTVVEPVIGEVTDPSPAAEAGIRAGDRIVAVDGEAVRGWRDVVIRIQGRAGEELTLTLERAGARRTVSAVPEEVREYSEVMDDSVAIGRLGIVLNEEAPTYRLGAGEAIARGWHETVGWIEAVIGFVVNLVTGETSARDLGGPIMIGKISGEAARLGTLSLLNFMGVISVNLAILNLLPIPILDGGQLLFLAVEGLRGRALSIEQRIRLTQLGFVIIVGLMIWAIGNDILRLLGI